MLKQFSKEVNNAGFVPVNKNLLKNLSINEALFLGELISKSAYYEERGRAITIDGQEGWFYCTVENMQEDTSLSKFQQKQAVKNLVEKGLILTKVAGLPAKRYFSICTEVVLGLVNPGVKVDEVLASEKEGMFFNEEEALGQVAVTKEEEVMEQVAAVKVAEHVAFIEKEIIIEPVASIKKEEAMEQVIAVKEESAKSVDEELGMNNYTQKEWGMVPGYVDITFDEDQFEKIPNPSPFKNVMENIHPAYRLEEVDGKPIKNKGKVIFRNVLDYVGNHWSDAFGVSKVSLDAESLKENVRRIITTYSVEEITKGIDNYREVLQSDQHFFSHQWSLIEFLTKKNALPVFMDDSVKEKYRIKGKASSQSQNEPFILTRDKEYTKPNESLNARFAIFSV